MAIKLLPKSEIARKQAVEQRTAVEEGAKLARRVDNLREVAAETETAYKKMRDETIAKINEEIGEKSKERDDVYREIQLAEDRLAKAQIPLDAKWEEVNNRSSELNRRTEEANVREYKVEDRERAVEAREKKLESALSHIQTKEDLATSNLRDAAYANSSAQQSRSSANRIKEEALALKAVTEKELINREEQATNRENGVTLREEAVAKKERFIQDEKARLRDREATLERAFKRINKTNG